MKPLSRLLVMLRDLSPERSERRLLAAAAVVLMRHRRRLLRWAAPLIAAAPVAGRSKLQLWSCLAAVAVDRSDPRVDPIQLREALQATQAYADARQRLARAHSGLWLRGGLSYRSLLDRWRDHPPQRLLLFHHYDRHGLLPSSWQEVLVAVQAAGWQVVFSSSDLQPCLIQELEASGIQIALRTNIGLCLGAYRDLSLLLSQAVPGDHLKSLVLCNDSNLPVQAPSAFLSQLQAWVEAEEAAAQPVLAGLTDSAQRSCYHLQSFLLYANRALLQHPAWLRFWLGFSLAGSKDDLINNGEIGLSQALLAAGVQLRPAYPLVQGLLSDPAMAEELQRYSIWQPRHVNQSLFAWQSLLARGFPLVKKHVLFELIENQGLPMAMAELARWIPEQRRELLAADLQELFVSRYSGGTPELG